MNYTSKSCWGAFLLTFLCGQQAMLCAAESEPMAIRRWPGNTISLETHWGHCMAIRSTEKTKGQIASRLDQELSIDAPVDHVLTRLPNEEKTSWISTADAPKDPNAVRAKSIPGEDGTSNGIELNVDGVKIVILAKQAAANQPTPALANVDLLILSLDTESPTDGWSTITKSIQPRFVLLNSQDLGKEFIEAFKKSVNAAEAVQQLDHNTLALSKTSAEFTQPQLVTLTTTEWQMPNDLAELFAAMEKSSGDSQAVFAKLSTNQMNFKPSNGTHTPRWNTEHMMGRQLGFFSKIYHTQDPTLPVMDLNPKQMPPDYEFAHHDWSGKEEARQMERVSQYTRRFAYLLSGLDLDKQAPGSRWPSLRALLKQMHRHYSEHTANTIKKFDLPEWPRE